MKPSFANPLLSAALLISATLPALAADLYWDVDGDTTATTGGIGIWQTTSTWRDGSDIGTLGDWADGTSPFNTAVFGGTAGNVALNSNVSINQIKFLVGANSGTGIYNLGQTGSGTITFGGTYDSTTPAIDATGIANVNGSATITAKITGTITGGLYIKANNKMFAGYTTGTVGRIYLVNATANDFIGDVSIDGGSLHSWSSMGNSANKIILKNGGGLYGNSGSNVNYDLARDIVVSDGGGAVGSYSSGTAQVITKLAEGKTITGDGDLKRFQSATALGTGSKEEVWLLGDMSGYTGLFENVKGTTLIETSATSAGTWKVSGGTVMLNTTDDTHIAHGSGKSDLLMNGGTLNMNGKSETINGLDGTGTIQNQLASTTSTLTLGAGDATASFGGVIRNNTTSGGKMALVKTGSGIQTLSGNNLYTGDTTVTAGTLTLDATGSMRFAPTTNGISNKLTGAGTANLNGTLNLDLNAANPTVGNSWTLVDVATANYALVAITSTPALTFTQAGPLWSAPSGANIWTFNQSNGKLSLTAASAFTSWITTPAFGLAPADQDPTDDPDNDGLDNLLEFVLNGTPSSSDPAILPDLAVTATDFEFTFSRRDDSLSPETTQTFQYGTNLVTWTDIVVPAANGTVGAATITVTDGSPADTVKISIPKTEAGASGKLFGRLQVTKP